MKGREIVRCLLCKGDLTLDNGVLYDGGYVEVSFHYGSKYDQEFGYGGRKLNRNESELKRLLSCDKIETHICEDCFLENLSLFRGYDVIRKTEETRVV